MKNIQKKLGKIPKPINLDFFETYWEDSWTYIKTVVDVVRQPILVLDKDFRVLAANKTFYDTFRSTLKDTEGKLVYKLGNGQWNIPSLRKLLEKILPKRTHFEGFQVAHEFPVIGRKVMILNARQIHIKSGAVVPKQFSHIILLAMEDVTEMMAVAESLSGHVREIEMKLISRTQSLEEHIGKLEMKLRKIKK